MGKHTTYPISTILKSLGHRGASYKAAKENARTDSWRNVKVNDQFHLKLPDVTDGEVIIIYFNQKLFFCLYKYW